MALTKEQFDAAKEKLRSSQPAPSSKIDSAKTKLRSSPSSEAVKRIDNQLKTQSSSIGMKAFNALQSVGGAMQTAAEKGLKPIAKEIAKPFLRTAATGVSALRGAWNLATGNIEAEQLAQAEEASKGGINLGVGKYQPVRDPLEVAGVGTQIAGTIASAGVGALGAAVGAPAAATGLVAGGIGGLSHGIGAGLETAGIENKDLLDTVHDVSAQGATEGAAGAALGYAGGKVTDWWNKPVKPVVKPPAEPKGPKISIVEKGKEFIDKHRKPLPNDSVRNDVLAKAAALDASDVDDSIIRSSAPGASGKKSPELGSPKKMTATKSVEKLLKNGLDPNDLKDLSELSPEDLQAVSTAINNGKRISLRPSEASSIRVNEGVANNMMRKVDALEKANAPIAKALSTAVKNADPDLFDEAALSAKLSEALPDRTVKFSDADKKFVEKLIDKVGDLKTPQDVHEFRQFIANETDAYSAPLRQAGVSNTEGEQIASAMRKKAGEYLDDIVPNYGDLRRQERPILDALDEFWSQMGGKWKNYDGDALDRRAAELSGRISSKASANVQRAIEKVDSALKAEGLSVGGRIDKQDYYARLVEELFNAGPPGSFKGQTEQAILQATDITNAIRHPVDAAIDKTAGKVLTGTGLVGKRAQERATNELREAFEAYISALLKRGGPTVGFDDVAPTLGDDVAAGIVSKVPKIKVPKAIAASYPEAEMLPVNKLAEFRQGPVRDYDMALFNDIKKNGIKDPLILAYITDGDGGEPYLALVEGNNRLAIAEKLGLKHIPVILESGKKLFKPSQARELAN